MAVKNCKECGKEIAKSSRVCIHCGSKKNYNPALTAIGILLLLGVVGLFLFIYKPWEHPTNPTPVEAVKEVAKDVAASVDDDDRTINKSEFEQIQIGTGYDESVNIIGCQGSLASETGTVDSADHVTTYTWKGHGALGSNASLIFQGGKLVSKSQVGLK